MHPIIFTLLIFIVTGLNSTVGVAQAPVSGSIANECCQSLNKEYFKSYFIDTRDIFIAPANWKKNDLLKFGAITATGAVLYWQDENIQQWSQTLRNNTIDQIVKYGIEPWANYYSIAVIAGVGIYGVAADHQKSREVSLIATKTLVVTTGFSQLAKFIFQRHRPYQNEPPDARKWDFFIHGLSDHKSFPSGHSVEAFAMAAVFANAYKDKKAVPVIAYSLASLVALSRVYENKHWASDVFIGSAFGFFMGKLIYKNSTK